MSTYLNSIYADDYISDLSEDLEFLDEPFEIGTTITSTTNPVPILDYQCITSDHDIEDLTLPTTNSELEQLLIQQLDNSYDSNKNEISSTTKDDPIVNEIEQESSDIIENDNNEDSNSSISKNGSDGGESEYTLRQLLLAKTSVSKETKIIDDAEKSNQSDSKLSATKEINLVKSDALLNSFVLKSKIQAAITWIATNYEISTYYKKLLVLAYQKIKLQEAIASEDICKQIQSYWYLTSLHFNLGNNQEALLYAVYHYATCKKIGNQDGVDTAIKHIAFIRSCLHMPTLPYDQIAMEYDAVKPDNHSSGPKHIQEINCEMGKFQPFLKTDVRLSEYKNKGEILFQQLKFMEAYEIYREALLLAEELNDKKSQQIILYKLGQISNNLRSKNSIYYFQQHLYLSEELDDVNEQCNSLSVLTEIFKSQHNYKSVFLYAGCNYHLSRRINNFDAACAAKIDMNSAKIHLLWSDSIARKFELVYCLPRDHSLNNNPEKISKKSKYWQDQHNQAIQLFGSKRYQSALKRHEENFTFARFNLKNALQESISLQYVALCDLQLNNYDDAIFRFRQLLIIADKLDDHCYVMGALFHLLDSYHKKADHIYRTNSGIITPIVKDCLIMAAEFCQQRISLLDARFNNTNNELIEYYHRIAIFNDAILVANQQLQHAKTGSSRNFQSKIQENIGIAYACLNQFDKTVDHYKIILTLRNSLQTPDERLSILSNLYTINCRLEKYLDASDNLRTYLLLCRNANFVPGICTAYERLIDVCKIQEDYNRAHIYAEKLLQERKKVDDQRGIDKANLLLKELRILLCKAPSRERLTGTNEAENLNQCIQENGDDDDLDGPPILQNEMILNTEMDFINQLEQNDILSDHEIYMPPTPEPPELDDNIFE